MSFLTLDIETVPMWRFTEPDVPVDPKWREEFVAEHRLKRRPNSDKAIELVAAALKSGEAKLKATGVQAALHPSTAHVISVSWGNSEAKEGEDTTVYQWEDFQGLEGSDAGFEVALLERTFRAIEAAIFKSRTLVSFSGKSFDLPSLRWRAGILGIKIPRLKWDGPGYGGKPAGLLYPFDSDTHCDLRLAWTNGNKYGRGTLAAMSAAFGIESEEHGGDVYSWFRANDWDSIRAYGHVEARNLIQLYRACERIL